MACQELSRGKGIWGKRGEAVSLCIYVWARLPQAPRHGAPSCRDSHSVTGVELTTGGWEQH